MNRSILAALASLAACSLAQQPIAPTGESTQSARGDNVGGYNILQSFEVGYRWQTAGGDTDMYRSTVNYTDGIRLLSSSLSIQSRDGHGQWFDQISLSTIGLGNDPYESASLRVEKNGWYRYDTMWRSNTYVNPALTIANDLHGMNTIRHLQDHDLTLFPQGKFRVFLGYSRNSQSGPALTTVQLFDSRGDEYPLFENINRQQNEYRLGGEGTVAGFRVNIMHGWSDYKEDSATSLASPSQGANLTDNNALNSLVRTEPYHGTSPFWRGAISRERRYWAVNGRISYVSGQRAFALNEFSDGFNRIGAEVLRQVTSVGNAQRPALAGSFNVALFPTKKITVSNHTSVGNIRMIGNSYLLQVDNQGTPYPTIPYEYLGIRTIANVTDVDLRLVPTFSLHGGYQYTQRRIQSQENLDTSSPSDPTVTGLFTQTNQLHSGLLGARWKPLKPVTITIDAELGRTDHPIYPISERNYQAGRARIEYRAKAFRVSTFGRIDYNTNSDSLANYASRTRQYGADGSWTPRACFAVDASYAKLHLNSLGALSYFVSPPVQDVTSTTSLYISNTHTATLAAHFTFLKRADVSVGFSHIQDTGDGRASNLAGLGTDPASVAAQAFYAVQTFPLRFTSPSARLSIRLTEKIRWNAGYQYYGYREDFSTLQDYRANTGYTSLSWSF